MGVSDKIKIVGAWKLLFYGFFFFEKKKGNMLDCSGNKIFERVRLINVFPVSGT